jgi:hypothetical protein
MHLKDISPFSTLGFITGHGQWLVAGTKSMNRDNKLLSCRWLQLRYRMDGSRGTATWYWSIENETKVPSEPKK